MRKQRAIGVGVLCAGLALFCSTAAAQSAPSSTPAAAKSEEPKDALGRTTPRGTVVGFLLAARAEKNEVAAQYLNTRQRGQAAATLAHQLSVVLDHGLPTGLAELSDRPEGISRSLNRPDQYLIGTITSDGGNVEIVLERLDRGKDGLLWLFSSNTLSAIPRLYAETEESGLNTVIPKFLLETRILRISLFTWLTVFVGLPLLFLFLALLNRLLNPLVGLMLRRVRKTEVRQDPVILPMPIRLLIVAVTVRWVWANVPLPLLMREVGSSAAGVFTIAAIIWILFLLTAAGERLLLRRVQRFRHEASASLLRIARRVFEAVLVCAGILVSLRNFGVDLTAALAGLGVGGIAIALAAQKTLENMIGGISVVADRVMQVGDMVTVGEKSGVVERIGLRSTRLRTLDRTVVSIPNGQIANVNLENVSIRDKFWLHHTLGLRYETSVSMVREVLDRVVSLLAQNPRVEGDSVRVRFLGFGSSSLNVEIFAYIFARDWPQFLEIQQDLLLDVMEIVQAAGTGLAFPSQTLYLAKSNAPSADALLRTPRNSSTQLQDVT